MKRLLLLVFTMVTGFTLQAQELRCNIQITTQNLQGSNKQIFQTLQSSINEFMNGRAWSNYKFSNNERIECSLMFNIQSYSGDQCKGTLTLQVRRPVFNSSFNTVLLNYIDNDIDFTYLEYEPLEFSETAHLSNLTSVLAYYAYIILGLDFDSFGLKSGTEFFQKAEKVVNNAQNAKERGWRAGESTSRRNRYWLVHNILDEEYAPVREFLYNYHRLGLDLMYDKPVEGRLAIAESFILLQDLFKSRPDPFMHFFQVVLDAKSDEFVSIFKESMDDEKRRVTAVLNQIDPTHADKYRTILSGSK